jgi:pimeloyl-ACP methyl ester carboxylesterase
MRTLYIFLLILLSSCMKLDNNLYNLGEKINDYKFDAYEGEQDFRLDSSYDIPPGHISGFVVQSVTPGENNSYNIQCVYIGDQSRINTDTVILYCHGNKWHLDFYWQRAKLLAHVNGKSRYGVLMMDYRGYGLSDGSPDESGMYADVDACMQWLKSRGLTNERLVVYGFSLGSAPACELTASPRSMRPSKIILEAPFASADVMAQDASQVNMPAAYFTDLKIDNAEEIKKVKQPLLWIHGTNDNFLSFKSHGEVVFKNHVGSYKEASPVEGADHGEVPEKLGFSKYLEVIGRFVRR